MHDEAVNRLAIINQLQGKLFFDSCKKTGRQTACH